MINLLCFKLVQLFVTKHETQSSVLTILIPLSILFLKRAQKFKLFLKEFEFLTTIAYKAVFCHTANNENVFFIVVSIH